MLELKHVSYFYMTIVMNIVVVQYTFQRCQLNHGDHYYRFWKAEYQVKITDKTYPLHI
jgi:hypothetical protein